MANEKIINTRVQLKYDSYENWQKSTGILKSGELAIAYLSTAPAMTPGADDAQHPVLFKVGNGANKFSELPWASALAADVYEWAKAETVELVGQVLKFKNADGSYAATEVDLSGFVTEGELTAVTGNLNGLNTAAKTTLVAAINEVRQAVEVGGTGSVVTLAKLATPTAGSFATYQLYQGSDGEGHPIPVGDKIEIPVSTKVEASDNNGYIKVDDEEVQVYDDVFKADGKTVVACGGIAANSTVNGKTFQEILYNMMYPYQKPTISATASPNGGTYEKGNKQTITKVTATVTKKTDLISKVELFNGSTLVATKNGDDTISSSSTALVKNGGSVVFDGLSREVSSNGGQYNVKVTDTSGGTASANTGSFSFINAFYYGVCAADATINEALVKGLTKDLSAKGTKSYKYTTNAQRMVIAYPKSYGKLASIKDGSGLNNANAFGEPTTVNITNQYGVAEDYYVYANGATAVTNFTMNFAF